MNKNKIALAAAVLVFAPLTMAQPVIGNNVNLKAGLVSLDGADADSASQLRLGGHYFIDDALYAAGALERLAYGYDQSGFEFDYSITAITAGAGYEYPLSEGFAAFGEGRLGLAFASSSFDFSTGFGGTSSSESSETGFAIVFGGGVRYAADLLSAQADFTFTMVSVDDVDGDTTTLNLEGGYEVVEDIIAGGYLSLEGDYTVYGVSASYKF